MIDQFQIPINDAHGYETDFAPLDGGNYYRIKGIGVNGELVYCNVAYAFYSADRPEPIIHLLPNPVIQNLCIIGIQSQVGDSLEIRVLNTIGQTIAQEKGRIPASGIYERNLQTEGWQPGWYAV